DREGLEPAVRELGCRERTDEREDDPDADDEQPVTDHEARDASHRFEATDCRARRGGSSRPLRTWLRRRVRPPPCRPSPARRGSRPARSRPPPPYAATSGPGSCAAAKVFSTPSATYEPPPRPIVVTVRFGSGSSSPGS